MAGDRADPRAGRARQVEVALDAVEYERAAGPGADHLAAGRVHEVERAARRRVEVRAATVVDDEKDGVVGRRRRGAAVDDERGPPVERARNEEARARPRRA